MRRSGKDDERPRRVPATTGAAPRGGVAGGTTRRTGAEGLRAIEDLRISATTYAVLAKHGIFTVLEILRLGRRGLLKLKNFGPKGLKDLQQALRFQGLEMSDAGHEPVPRNPTELWTQTGDLSPQATLETRAVVARIKALAHGKTGLAAIAAQWPEFMGFVIAEITDIRGAMTRDDSKFANLVAHTEETVSALQGAIRLREELRDMRVQMREVLSKLEEFEPPVPGPDYEGSLHFGLIDDTELVPGEQTIEDFYSHLERVERENSIAERVRYEPHYKDEPVLVEKEPERHDLVDYRYDDDDD